MNATAQNPHNIERCDQIPQLMAKARAGDKRPPFLKGDRGILNSHRTKRISDNHNIHPHDQ